MSGSTEFFKSIKLYWTFWIFISIYSFTNYCILFI